MGEELLKNIRKMKIIIERIKKRLEYEKRLEKLEKLER